VNHIKSKTIRIKKMQNPTKGIAYANKREGMKIASAIAKLKIPKVRKRT
jgi:hypothetical protein